MTTIPNFETSRRRTAAILKIVLSLYLSRKSSDFNEIWYADGGESAFTYYDSSFSQCDGYDVGISQRTGASAAAVYVSPELYSLPVSQEFASLRPPLGGRTRLVIIILPSVSIPEGGLKIDENKLKGYDAQSVQSGTGRLSCSRTALKRCTSTETH